MNGMLGLTTEIRKRVVRIVRNERSSTGFMRAFYSGDIAIFKQLGQQ